jgi:peptidoglycan/xylan/chitin deacetylase (PgdA/CDA1 family)
VVVNGLRRLVRAAPTEREPVVHRGGKRLWLRRNNWRLLADVADTHRGRDLISFESNRDGSRAVTVDDDGVVHVPFDVDAVFETYVSERWVARSGNRSLSPAQLDLFYRVKGLIPRQAQLSARRLLIRRHGLPVFPDWPVDTSVESLARFYLHCLIVANEGRDQRFDWFWPAGATAAITLSHDVETAEGLALAVKLADLEEDLGFRSSFNVGAWYKPDPGILRELKGRGFEIGCHALKHDRSLFESRSAFESSQTELRAFAERIGAVGFRSPATHRVYEWLGELPFEYDGTIPHSDPYEPQPGGCCSLWPFFVGDVVEVPYTLPQDHTLFTLLREGSARRWLDAAARIERAHGLIHCVSHPDPGYLGDVRKAAYYRDFLTAVRERPLWRALPYEVARWWRRRDDGGGQPALAAGGGSPEELELKPPAAERGSSQVTGSE